MREEVKERKVRGEEKMGEGGKEGERKREGKEGETIAMLQE